jgi:hypothetical protein
MISLQPRFTLASSRISVMAMTSSRISPKVVAAVS